MFRLHFETGDVAAHYHSQHAAPPQGIPSISRSYISTSSVHFGPAIPLVLLTALPAVGATSFANAITGFSGNSTQPATHAALAAAGFNIANTVDIDSATSL
jgi:hypothetical protein